MKTSDYYKKNPDAYAKKKAYDTEYNKSKEATKKRSKLNRFNRKKKTYGTEYNKSKKATKKRSKLNKFNRKKGTYGNGDGMDACHKKYKGKTILTFCKAKSNRGDTNDTK